MLNRETFMLTSTHLSGSLKIYSISHGKRIPTLLASLHLPELQPEYHLRAIDSHSGPVHACPPENRFFTTVPYPSHFSLLYWTCPWRHRSYSVFIHNDQLIGIAKSNPPDRTYCGIHGVLSILDSYPVVFLGCGNFFIWLYLYVRTQYYIPDVSTASESSARHRKWFKYSILRGLRIHSHPEPVKHSCDQDQTLHVPQKHIYLFKMSWRTFLTIL